MATSALKSKKTLQTSANNSQTKNVVLKWPKISFSEGYFGRFKGSIFFCLGWKALSNAIFPFFLVLLGAVGHSGSTIVQN